MKFIKSILTAAALIAAGAAVAAQGGAQSVESSNTKSFVVTRTFGLGDASPRTTHYVFVRPRITIAQYLSDSIEPLTYTETRVDFAPGDEGYRQAVPGLVVKLKTVGGRVVLTPVLLDSTHAEVILSAPVPLDSLK